MQRNALELLWFMVNGAACGRVDMGGERGGKNPYQHPFYPGLLKKTVNELESR